MKKHTIAGMAAGLFLCALPLAASAAEPYQVRQMNDENFRQEVRDAQAYQREVAKQRMENEAQARRARMENARDNREAVIELRKSQAERAREARMRDDGFNDRVREAQEYQRNVQQQRMEMRRDAVR